MSKQTQPLNTPTSRIDIADLLKILASRIKVLIVIPALAGVIAYGVCFIVPQTYSSEAILSLPSISINALSVPGATPAAQASVMMVSPLVLDPVIQDLKLGGDKSIQAVRKDLVKQVKPVVGKDGLLRLETLGETPREAQVLGNAILARWLKSTLPGADESNELETRLRLAKSSLDQIELMFKRLTAEGVADLSRPLSRSDVTGTLVAVGELKARYLDEVLVNTRKLKGFTQDVIKQIPTLPTESVSPKKTMVAVLVSLGTAILLIIFILVRESWMRKPSSVER